MASHNRTPASVLEAPSQSVVVVAPAAGPNRAARRLTDRALRLSAPRRVWLPRVRPRRPVHPDAVLSRQARRAEALAWRRAQGVTRNNEKAARTLLREGVTW